MGAGACSIVNVCGRFWLLGGLDARFSPETRSELWEKGSLAMPHPRTGALYTLTHQVRASAAPSS